MLDHGLKLLVRQLFERVAVLNLVLARHQQSEDLEIGRRLGAAHLRNGLFPVLGEIPQPAAYLKILALLVPREHKVEHRNLLKEMTDEELEAAIEALQAMMATQAENAKVIEGTAHDTALPVPTECEQLPHKRRNRLLEHADTAIGPSRKPR